MLEICKKYLLVISNKYNVEYEMYYSLKDLLEDTGAKSVSELVDRSCWLCEYKVYEIEKTYKKIDCEY